MKIILDTNFIISALKNKIQLFDLPYIWIIPEEVIKELKEIKNKGNLKDRQTAEIALELIKKNKTKKIKLNTRDVDSGIIKIAIKKNYIIASLDKEMKRKAKKLGIVKFMIIRNKKKLEIL